MGNLGNVMIALTKDAALKNLFRFDNLSNRVAVWGALPTDSIREQTFPHPLTDIDVWSVIEYLNRRCKISHVSQEVVRSAIERRSLELAFNPLQEYLSSLKWDGEPRIRKILTSYFGVEESEYAERTGRAWMISAVARAFLPGCKVDNMVVLEGEQGVGKSRALRILFGDWFGDQLPPVNGDQVRVSMYITGGFWGIEIAELASIRKTDIEDFKSFVSRQEERFVKKYGHLEEMKKRTFIFVGTTNSREYLSDFTGNRRVWGHWCSKIDLAALKRDRDQLWAEAVEAFRAREQWWLDGEDEQRLCAPQQEERLETDGWEEVIESWIKQQHRSFTATEVASKALRLEASEINKSVVTRIGHIIKRIGCKRGRRTALSRPYLPL